MQNAVVLVVQHSPTASVGLVLNHASSLAVNDLHILESTKRAFGASALRVGGRCSHQSVLLLHGEPRVADAHTVCPGVYTGGLSTAQGLVESGASSRQRFCLLAGYCSWQPGQLEADVAAGMWSLVSASPELVLDLACDEQRTKQAWHELLCRTCEPERTYVSWED